MVNVKCVKCGLPGSLTVKQTKTLGKTYFYYYVEHHIGGKIKWCYLGKPESLPSEYVQLIHKNDTQNNTQSTVTEKHKLGSFQKNICWARSSARLERQAHNLLVAGSSPAGPTISSLVGEIIRQL